MRTVRNKKKTSLLLRILRGLYILLFAVSLVIVVLYLAFRLFVRSPDVESQVTFTPTVETTGSGSSGDSSSQQGQPSVQPLVLTRREGVYTCMLLGCDDGYYNADTIMLGVFDTRAKTASLVSIPRDTLVFAKGKDRKLNATYAAGGEELVVATVEQTLGIPVDFYVSVQLEAFASIVDEIGGVWFYVPMNMDYDDPFQDLHIHVKEGYQLLDGETALGVMRFRHGYSDQDIGRVETQRSFLSAMVSQTITLSNASKVTSLIRILQDYVDSDMPLDNMIYFATQAIGMDLGSALSSATLPTKWVYPYSELQDEQVLAVLNSLGIYEEPIPAEVLNIRHK